MLCIKKPSAIFQHNQRRTPNRQLNAKWISNDVTSRIWSNITVWHISAFSGSRWYSVPTLWWRGLERQTPAPSVASPPQPISTQKPTEATRRNCSNLWMRNWEYQVTGQWEVVSSNPSEVPRFDSQWIPASARLKCWTFQVSWCLKFIMSELQNSR